MTDAGTRIEEALAALTLEEKVRLLTGRDFWTTWPIEKIGLRRVLVSDGPSGIRGETWDERDPSLNLPSATALASSSSTNRSSGWTRRARVSCASGSPRRLAAKAPRSSCRRICWTRRRTSVTAS